MTILPPSLKNIFKELANDIPTFRSPNHGCLGRNLKYIFHQSLFLCRKMGKFRCSFTQCFINCRVSLIIGQEVRAASDWKSLEHGSSIPTGNFRDFQLESTGSWQ
jgi:hypothetical protein